MQISRQLPAGDKESVHAWGVFSKLLMEFSDRLRFDRVDFHVRDENKILVNGRKCTLILNRKHTFVDQMDTKGIKSIILRLFFKAILRTENDDNGMPELIEDIIANRRMYRSGFGEYVMYYYLYAENKMPETARQQVDGEAGSISLYPDDKYNSEYLRKMEKRRFDTQKMSELLKKDLEDENSLEKAVLFYRLLG